MLIQDARASLLLHSVDLPAAPPAPVPVHGARAKGWAMALRGRAWLLLLLLPVAFAVYAGSFSAFPVIERTHSVLGDADAANFAVLLRDFDLGHRYGNEYAAQHRGLGDNAQKHKIHHVLYALAGSAVHRVAAPVYRALGIPQARALYAVNALVAVANLVLLATLLRGA
ncbi:MAG TPA: hypothetical protein VFQ39_16485, partial [Longimicrobium sp.]|nr:hypothetical protein [Longimicrobium sp.]